MQGVTVDFNANLTRFTNAVDKTTSNLNRFQTNAERVSSQVNRAFAGLGVGLTAGVFVGFIKQSIDAADNLNDMAQRTGISVEQLSGLKLVADQSGTSLEGLGNALKKLSVNLVEASSGNNEMSKTFKGLGIAGTDSQEAFYKLADVFAAMPDGANKTALAIKLIGKSGADMIPLLNQGGTEIKRMADEGARLSGMSTSLAKQADKFNDEMAKMKIAAGAAGLALADKMLPAMNDIAEAMIRAQKESGKWAAVLTGIGGVVVAAFGGATNPIDMASNKAKGLFDELFAAKKKLNELQTTKNEGGISGFLIRDEDIERNKRYVDDVKERLRGVVAYRDALIAAQPVATKKPKGTAADGAISASDLPRSFQFEEDLRRMHGEAGKELGALAKDFELPQKRLDELLAGADFTKLKKDQEDMAFLALAFTDGIKQADGSMRKLSEAEYLDAVRNRLGTVGEKTEEVSDFARDMGLSFTSAFEDAMLEGKNFSDVLKALDKDIARIIIRKSITEPMGDAVSGAVKSSGMGDWFKNILGFAGGGNPPVGVPYLVGENGPELRIDRSPGTIIPNKALGGLGVTTINNNFNVDMRGASVEAVDELRKLVMQVNGSIEHRALSAVTQARTRGAF